MPGVELESDPCVPNINRGVLDAFAAGFVTGSSAVAACMGARAGVGPKRALCLRPGGQSPGAYGRIAAARASEAARGRHSGQGPGTAASASAVRGGKWDLTGVNSG